MNPATIPAWLEPVSTDLPMTDRTVDWWADAPDDTPGAIDAARRLAREVHAWRTGTRP